MNVDQLEEFEGVTPQLVRAYMERKGWYFRGLQMDGSAQAWPPACEGGSGFAFRYRPSALDVAVQKIAIQEGRSVQALLREMAPRWAPFPSAAAIQAHEEGDGFWLMQHPKLGVMLVALDADRAYCGEREISRQELERYGARFWPVNENGDRVPMPKAVS